MMLGIVPGVPNVPTVVLARLNGFAALFAATALATVSLATTSLAAPQVKLSSGITESEEAVRRHPASNPLALVIDVASLDAVATESMLHAIDDRRREGGTTFAVVGAAGDGAAIVALSCDALVTLPSARLAGASAEWCPSPSRREAIAQAVARLGRLATPFGERLVDADGPLSWDKTAGFEKSADGGVLLASDGSALELSSAQLEQVGLVARGFKDLDAAIAAVEARLMRPREAAPEIAAAKGGSKAGERPGGRLGVPPASGPGGASAPAGLAGSTESDAPKVDMAKLAPKLAEYREVLGDFKAKLKEFDGYYRGVSGVWTSQHDSLKEVWQSKTEMTRDKDTKVRCSRLQQDIRELVTKLESIARSIGKICDDKAHPDVVRTSAGVETLKQLREAIQRNEVDDYDKYKPLAERLQ